MLLARSFEEPATIVVVAVLQPRLLDPAGTRLWKASSAALFLEPADRLAFSWPGPSLILAPILNIASAIFIDIEIPKGYLLAIRLQHSRATSGTGGQRLVPA